MTTAIGVDIAILWANFTAQIEEQADDVAWALLITLAVYAATALFLKGRAVQSIRHLSSATISLPIGWWYLMSAFGHKAWWPYLIPIACGLVMAIAGCTVRRTSTRTERSVQDEIDDLGLEALHNVDLPVMGRAPTIDHLVFAGGIILVVMIQRHAGAIYGNMHSRHWTQVGRHRAKYQFTNPMPGLSRQVDGINCLVGRHAAGVVVFPDRTTFPNGRQSGVVTVSEFARVIELLDTKGRPEGTLAWRRLKTRLGQAMVETRVTTSPRQAAISLLPAADRREPSF